MMLEAKNINSIFCSHVPALLSEAASSLGWRCVVSSSLGVGDNSTTDSFCRCSIPVANY